MVSAQVVQGVYGKCVLAYSLTRIELSWSPCVLAYYLLPRGGAAAKRGAGGPSWHSNIVSLPVVFFYESRKIEDIAYADVLPYVVIVHHTAGPQPTVLHRVPWYRRHLFMMHECPKKTMIGSVQLYSGRVDTFACRFASYCIPNHPNEPHHYGIAEPHHGS